jgi:hypothetical protein
MLGTSIRCRDVTITHTRSRLFLCVFIALAGSTGSIAENKILGEVELQGASKVEKSSGVWVDGQYLGYLL